MLYFIISFNKLKVICADIILYRTLNGIYGFIAVILAVYSCSRKKIGIDSVKSGVKPDEKAQIINELKRNGKVIMIGDGINDAPALVTADVGMTVGSGTDIAVESADIVLMNASLQNVSNAIKLSKATMANIRQNLFWAFFYNILGSRQDMLRFHTVKSTGKDIFFQLRLRKCYHRLRRIVFLK